jgi:excisionase family DNA binding protein
MLVLTEDRMLDIAEVAKQLKVSQSTVRALVRSGKLHAYRIGAKRGRLRFKQEDVARYFDSTVVRPGDVDGESEGSPSADAYQGMKEHSPDLGDT